MTSVDATPAATSEQAAELGCVFVSGPDGEHELSEARAWREDGVYTLRSTEFDVIAEDEDFDVAIDVFVAWLIDYAALLAERVDSGKATEDEGRTFAVLSARRASASSTTSPTGSGCPANRSMRFSMTGAPSSFASTYPACPTSSFAAARRFSSTRSCSI